MFYSKTNMSLYDIKYTTRHDVKFLSYVGYMYELRQNLLYFTVSSLIS